MAESLAMRRMSPDELYRCDLCHRSVDADTRGRARRTWQPLIVCERCIREAEDDRPIPHRALSAAAA